MPRPPGSYPPTYYRPGHYYSHYPYYPYGGYGAGWYYPWGLGWGWSLYDPYYASYYGYGYGYGYGTAYVEYNIGSVRVQMAPRSAQVYVDGYYVGIVDEFDGAFQRLKLPEGPHRIEVRAEGFRSQTFDVRVLVDHTITLRGELRPIP